MTELLVIASIMLASACDVGDVAIGSGGGGGGGRDGGGGGGVGAGSGEMPSPRSCADPSAGLPRPAHTRSAVGVAAIHVERRPGLPRRAGCHSPARRRRGDVLDYGGTLRGRGRHDAVRRARTISSRRLDADDKITSAVVEARQLLQAATDRRSRPQRRNDLGRVAERRRRSMTTHDHRRQPAAVPTATNVPHARCGRDTASTWRRPAVATSSSSHRDQPRVRLGGDRADAGAAPRAAAA